jgi:replicative DNA helicase
MMMRGGPNVVTPNWGPASDLRSPPLSIEAEQGLLGAILLNNSALDRAEGLEGHHFYDALHGEIFEALQGTIGAGRAATPITLRTYFEQHAPVGELTVPQYLGTLAGKATTIINVPDYAQTIRDLHTRRSLILIGEDMVNGAYEAAVGVAPSVLVEETESRLLALVQDGPTNEQELSMAQAIDAALKRANEALKHKHKLRGLSCGLSDLDKTLGGLAPSDLIIIGGRPGSGKTSLATNVAESVALERMSSPGQRGGAFVHFFSQEMSAEQLATRVISHQAGVASSQIGRGNISDTQFRALMDAQQRLGDMPIMVDQSGGLTIGQLAARARRVKRKHGTGLIIIDYLQLMHGSSKENRTQDLTRITNGLKALAKELMVPIIALSQLSRGVEQREEKRPTLSDLRESGSIEQDADIVLFVYREEYYFLLKNPEPDEPAKISEWQTEYDKVKGKAEVLVSKHRHGPTGVVNLAFNKELTSFANLAARHQ